MNTKRKLKKKEKIGPILSAQTTILVSYEKANQISFFENKNNQCFDIEKEEGIEEEKQKQKFKEDQKIKKNKSLFNEIEAKISCSNCKAVSSYNNKFCPNCGTNLNASNNQDILSKRNIQKEIKELEERNTLLEGILCTQQNNQIRIRERIITLPNFEPQRLITVPEEGRMYFSTRSNEIMTKDTCITNVLIQQTSPAFALMLGYQPNIMRNSKLNLILLVEGTKKDLSSFTNKYLSYSEKIGNKVMFQAQTVYTHKDGTKYAAIVCPTIFINENNIPFQSFSFVKYFWRINNKDDVSSILDKAAINVVAKIDQN